MYYLKENVVAEPLVQQWYASLRNICPAMAAMVFANSFDKIMSSYVNAPQMHEIACKHPETKGGPFIEYEQRHTDEISKLLELTRQKCKVFYEFSDAIKGMNELLNKHPRGMSLEPLYEKLPELLKGCVELYYDVVNQPHFRLIEPMLYHSNLNTESLQSFVLYETNKDFRAFMLSTPRLDNPDDIKLNLPFSNIIYNNLFASREKGLTQQEIDALIEKLDIRKKKQSFMKLFSEKKSSRSYQPLAEDEPVRVRYFGHACVLVETHDTSILFDPVLSYVYPSDIERYTYVDLPEKIDYVVLSHSHQDHILIEHLIQLRYKIGTVIVPNNVPGAIQDPSLKLMLKSLGFNNVKTLDEFEKIEFTDGFIQGLPFLGEHSDLYIHTKLAYYINIAGLKMVCAVDSNNIDHVLYERIHSIIGDVDVLFIGMECVGAPLTWLYGPLMLTQITREMDQSRRLDGSNFEKAKKLVDLFNCKQVFIYAMGQEPWLGYVMGLEYTPTSPAIIESDKLVDYCKSKNMVAARLFGRYQLQL